MTSLFLGQYGVAIFACVVAVVLEARTANIPNVLTLGSIVAGLGVAALDGEWGSHLAGFAVAAGAMLLVYRSEVLGGGTVKLIAGLGCVLGFRPALAMLAGALALGLLVLAWLRIRRRSVEIMGSPFALAGVVAAAVAVRMPALQSVFN